MAFPWVVLLYEGLVVSMFSQKIAENDMVMCMIVIMINAAALLAAVFYRSIRKRNGTLGFMIVLGIVFRVALLIWDLNFSDIFRLPNSGLDTESFALWAQSGYLTGDYIRGGVYAKFIAFWYRIFGGVQRPVAQYLNILLAISAIMIVLRIMEYWNIEYQTQKLIVMLLCFLPNFAITNSILLRETLIIFLLTSGVYFFVRWYRESSIPFLFASAIFVCVAASVHSGAIAVLLGEGMVIVLNDRERHRISLTGKSFLWLIVLMAGFYVIYSQFGDMLFGKFQGVDSVEDVLHTAELYNNGGSAYDAGFQINNDIANLIINTPIRMFYFLTSPLPWSWRGLSDLIAFCFSSTVFIYAYYRAWIELRRCTDGERRTMIMMFVLLALSGALIFAWGVSNAGTALRHREKFIIIHILLIALCDDSRRKHICTSGREQMI